MNFWAGNQKVFFLKLKLIIFAKFIKVHYGSPSQQRRAVLSSYSVEVVSSHGGRVVRAVALQSFNTAILLEPRFKSRLGHNLIIPFSEESGVRQSFLHIVIELNG